MPDLLMFTEAAFLTGPRFATPHPRHVSSNRVFETLAEMEGVDIDRLDPAVLRNAKVACAHCAAHEACRRWLRTGIFKYAGDPRCPNAALLLHH